MPTLLCNPPGSPFLACTVFAALQAAAAPVGRMLDRASLLFDARCYMHHYERHGLSCTGEKAGRVADRKRERYFQVTAEASTESTGVAVRRPAICEKGANAASKIPQPLLYMKKQKKQKKQSQQNHPTLHHRTPSPQTFTKRWRRWRGWWSGTATCEAPAFGLVQCHPVPAFRCIHTALFLTIFS